MDDRQSSRGPLRRGTATTEFLLSLPLLLAVLSLVFFAGYSMMRKQRVAQAGRFAAWQRADGRPVSDGWLSHEFLADRPAALDQQHIPGPEDARELWIAKAARQRQGSARLAEALFDEWPGGVRTQLSAEYTLPVNLPESFAGPIVAHAGRQGLEWRREDVQPWRVLTEQYYQDLDDRLVAAEQRGSGLAGRVRGLYRWRW